MSTAIQDVVIWYEAVMPRMGDSGGEPMSFGLKLNERFFRVWRDVALSEDPGVAQIVMLPWECIEYSRLSAMVGLDLSIATGPYASTSTCSLSVMSRYNMDPLTPLSKGQNGGTGLDLATMLRRGERAGFALMLQNIETYVDAFASGKRGIATNNRCLVMYQLALAFIARSKDMDALCLLDASCESGLREGFMRLAEKSFNAADATWLSAAYREIELNASASAKANGPSRVRL